MPLALSDIRPYQSFLLARSAAKPRQMDLDLVNRILTAVAEILELELSGSSRVVQNRINATENNKLKIATGAVHYVHTKQAAWSSDSTISDRLNHLIVVVQSGQLIALHFSEAHWKARIALALYDKSRAAFAGIEIIPAGILNAAFVDGDTKTLWLSGTHQQARWKADNKVLTGIDLRDALDRIEDQTYHFTAARCRPDFGAGISVTAGVSPGKSQVWIGTSRDNEEFLKNTVMLFDRIRTTAIPNDNPLPILAAAINDLTNVEDAYAISVVPSELEEDAQTDQNSVLLHERYATQSHFDITKSQGTEATADVYLSELLLGEMTFRLIAKNGQIALAVTGIEANQATQAEFSGFMRFCQGRGHVKIWFESGHTFVGGRVYSARFHDVDFREIDFDPFASFNVAKEKPTANAPIGSDDSLFCWVLNEWASKRRNLNAVEQWLGCDDGAHEKADFICLELDRRGASPPKILLLHVKGVHVGRQKGGVLSNRAVSVADYEVVVGQAIKNVRWLDRMVAVDRSADKYEADVRNRVKYAWKNGAKSSPSKFADAIRDNLRRPYEAEVIVIQPQATDEALKTATSGTKLLRKHQLHILLNQARTAANNVGAKFSVISQSVPAAATKRAAASSRRTP
jgi:hypothetical protein